MKPTYPEHDKLRAVKDDSQKLGEFLTWLQERDVHLATYAKNRIDLHPIDERIEIVLADYFGIDLDRIETEKRQMLSELRLAQGIAEE